MNTFQFHVTAKDIDRYGMVSGDLNPLHFDDAYAKESGFSGRVAHGMLSMAKVLSFVENEYLNPLAMIREYEMTFLAPVYVDAVVTLEVSGKDSQLHLTGKCNEEVVLKGKIRVERFSE